MLQYATNLIKCKKETKYFLRPITAATINKKKTLNLEGQIRMDGRRVRSGYSIPNILDRNADTQNALPKSRGHPPSFRA
jgi:hypothetical protein